MAVSNYQGMRWFKSDFQVQTPEDNKHWDDDDLRLLSPRRPNVDGKPSEQDIQEKARVFLRRCHQLELEVIGLTDHNFSEKTDPRDWFITHLVEQNKSVAKDLGRNPICILPGFEVDIGYHMLCLFEPATKQRHIERVNMILIKLGLAPNQRFKNGMPTMLCRDGQALSLRTLLEVVQKEHSGIVIAAHADQNDGLLSSPRNIVDYQLPALLAIELTTYPIPEKYRAIFEGRNREWSRVGQAPAYVQSSDAKSLKVGADGRPFPNSLGYRHTWVKSSKPSILSLRQAFMDGPSRLRLQEDRPSDGQTHPRIVFIGCRGLKFLADQHIHFSPNLNTLIGGRGTGKSTVLELLRFAFGRDQGDVFSDSIIAKFERVRGTYTDDAVIEVGWESIPGQVDVIGFSPKAGHVLLKGEAHDLETYLKQLPLQFYSQQQLSELTGVHGASRLLGIIDEACAAELQALKGQEETLRAEINQLFAIQDQSASLKSEIKSLTQELQELNRQWQARHEVQAEAQGYQRAEIARRYFEQIKIQLNDDMRRVTELAETFRAQGVLNEGAADAWPQAAWFNALSQEAASLRKQYGEQLTQLLDQQNRDFFRLIEDGGWNKIEGELNFAKSSFLQACTDRGLQPQDVARLQEIAKNRQTKQQSLEDKQRRAELLQPQGDRLAHALNDLSILWNQQFSLRQRTAFEISEKAGNSIQVVVKKMDDLTGFLQCWSILGPDGRSRLGRAWEYIGQQLFESFKKHLIKHDSESESPWTYIKDILIGERDIPLTLLEYPKELKDHLATERQAWRGARVSRIEDRIDIELYRADGTLVGSVESNALSEGQRNTAVLNLLLAKGDGPIIIDQPEDELDSNFIYRELVPLLRNVKNKRQLILATHNANLPVNADSDLVYALEVSEGRGSQLAVGGLDRTDTTNSVLDIMEGSAEAFKRRFEKYHF